MKKMWKRTLAVLTAALLLVAAAPAGVLPDVLSFTAAAESFSGYCGDDLKWSLNTTVGELTITGTGKMENYDPWDNYAPWYAIRGSIKTVSLPDGLTTIGEYAFYGCMSLASVTIPDSVTSIWWEAFSGCTSLTSVTIPDSVTTIGYEVFSGCTSLADVTIPDSVKNIPNGIFCGCTSLASVTIPDSVTTIEAAAFSGCTSLASVTIPNSVTEIGWYAFEDCTSLADVTIPDSVTEIGRYAFEDCTSLADVTIPDSVTTIRELAFYRCTNLKTVTIGSGLSFAFFNVNYVDLYYSGYYSIFSDCPSLSSITVDPHNTAFCSDADGVLYSKDKTVLFQYPIGDPRTTYTVPDTVRIIGSAAFGMCTNLTSVRLPESLDSICEDAFASCANLERVMLGNSVRTIDSGAFYGCTSLTRMTVPASVEKIYGGAFYNVCNIIYSGKDPDASEYAWGARSVNGYVDGNFVYESAEKKTLRACSSAAQGAVTVADGVTEIGERAFYGCTDVTSVTIPDGVTSIGDLGFAFCKKLTSVKMPESLKSIGNQAFRNCESLVGVTIPDGTERIGAEAFGACTMLEYVHIPASVTTIDGAGSAWMLVGCTKLDRICSDKADCYARQFAAEHGVEFVVCTGHPDPLPEPDPVIAIRNYTQERTVDYRTTITFAVDAVQDPVEGAQVVWLIDGQQKGTGESVTVTEAKRSFTVQAKYVKDGAVLAESATETVNVKTGFFARLKAFFRSLFKKLPVVVQEYIGVQYQQI